MVRFLWQFFYVITELYKDGVVKEMKKWAYEIHSCFLLPGAPVPIITPTMDEAVLMEIDETLRKEHDKEEILRKVTYCKSQYFSPQLLGKYLLLDIHTYIVWY